MLSVMPQLFADARLKVNRANKHISELESRIVALPNAYLGSVKLNPDRGSERLEHRLEDKKVISDIALSLGDAIHNLNCALDYTWLETIERLAPAAVGKFAKFPVRESFKELKAALEGAKIHKASPKLFDFVITKIQPYSRGNHAIWPVHHLDIRDKHRLLIPILHIASIDGITVEDQHGGIWKGTTYGTTQEPPYCIDFEPGLHVKEQGCVVIQVFLEDAKILGKIYVPEAIRLYSQFVLAVVEDFERFVGA